MERDNLNKTIKEIFEDKYVVPFYQRNFAWRKDEIERLLQDIYENFKANKESNYFIGSLIVLRRIDGVFEVIDGQQRLTVLSLLTKKLKITKEPKLAYDSRPEVETFFDAFYNGLDINSLKESSKLYHLIDAVAAINESNLSDKDDNILTIDNLPQSEKKDFTCYFENKVILVRVEMPEDTDVASYFEIMNNRGEQLQKHEIVKSHMISIMDKKNIDRKKQNLFAKIWDACSQMDIPIQKLFAIDLRKTLFGNNFDEFSGNIENINFTENGSENTESTSPCLYNILRQDFNINNYLKEGVNNNNEIDAKDELGQKAIIDFPNFLMHVFRLKYKDKINDEIPLNEKYLLDSYRKIAQIEDFNPMDFIKTLLYYRTIFDRFIIRSIDDPEEEDSFKWIIWKPKFDEKVSSVKYDKNSFPDNVQNYLVKAMSMLQVRFRNRIYKDWLNESLRWIAEKYSYDINDVEGNEYLKFFHGLMLDYYKNNYGDCTNDKWKFKGEGQNTPHFLFFFIDYLYWVSSKKNITGIANLNYVDDFDFKYWNSVEHHLPQSYEDDAYPKELIDDLGNLCLVSKSANSRMNNESPVGKSDKNGKYYKKGLSPKRKIMYDTTNRDSQWGEEQIKQHYKDVVNLLSRREEILSK